MAKTKVTTSGIPAQTTGSRQLRVPLIALMRSASSSEVIGVYCAPGWGDSTEDGRNRRSAETSLFGSNTFGCVNWFNPANEAIQRFVETGILRQVNTGRRNRAFEAPKIIAACAALQPH